MRIRKNYYFFAYLLNRLVAFDLVNFDNKLVEITNYYLLIDLLLLISFILVINKIHKDQYLLVTFTNLEAKNQFPKFQLLSPFSNSIFVNINLTNFFFIF